MMCPSFLLPCHSLTSSRNDIRIQHETHNLPSLSSFSFSSCFQALPLLLSFCDCPSCVHMMNRTRSSSNPFEDPKVELRHHSLMQDYRELHMEAEAKRKKLHAIRERKATLVAEVRFLRRRYRHLRHDQSVMQLPDVKKVRGRSNGGKKIKKYIRVEVSPNKLSNVETKHVSLPDLNHSGNAHDEIKTSLKRKVPLFDLNQISGEEEEETETVNNDHEKMRVEESNSNKRTNSSLEMQQQHQKEMKLSSCRDGSNKRKISWQDLSAALV